MPSITSKKLGYNTAKFWRNVLYNSGATDAVLYISAHGLEPKDDELPAELDEWKQLLVTLF